MQQLACTAQAAAGRLAAATRGCSPAHRRPLLPLARRQRATVADGRGQCPWGPKGWRAAFRSPATAVSAGGPQGPVLPTTGPSDVSDGKAAFHGKWVRQAAKSQGAAAYLVAHGVDEEQAKDRCAANYEQEWVPTGVEEGEWRVTTTSYKGTRSVVYSLGEWEEPFEGGSDLFGDAPGVAYRNTSWEETATLGYVHLTESATPLGWEATQRHVDRDSGLMVVRRMFTPRAEDGSAGEQVSCVEYFEKAQLWVPSAAA